MPNFRVTAAIVQDTFREAMASKIFWGLFGLSTAMILFFLFLLKIDLVEGALATVTLFGKESRGTVPVERLLAGVFAGVSTFLYSLGMLLAVFASAGLIPSILEPGRIELLLSKPVSRTHMLLGRYLGNLLVVAVNTTYLVGGVWIILGLKSGLWEPRFLVSIGTSLAIFAVLLTVVVLVGVIWQSTALSTMIPVAIVIISVILAQTRTMERLLSSEWSRQLWMGLYYALPKVYDLGRTTVNVIMERQVDTWMPLWSSAIFGVVVLSAGVTWFVKRDC